MSSGRGGLYHEQQTLIQALLTDDTIVVVKALRACREDRSVASLVQESGLLNHPKKVAILANLSRYILDLIRDDVNMTELNVENCEAFFSEECIERIKKALVVNRRYQDELPKEKMQRAQINALTSLLPKLKDIIGEDTKEFPNELVIGQLLVDISKISENANRVLRRLCTTSHPKALLIVRAMFDYVIQLGLDPLQKNKDGLFALAIAEQKNPAIHKFLNDYVDQFTQSFFNSMAAATQPRR